MKITSYNYNTERKKTHWIWFAICLIYTMIIDQDLVTIFDDSDLSFAIQCSRILKITLFGEQNNFVFSFFFYFWMISMQIFVNW